MPGRARGLGPAVFPAALLAAVGLGGCTDLHATLPPDLAALIGPPQKRVEATPAHQAATVGVPAEPAAPPTVLANVAPTAPVRPPIKDVRELIGLERHEVQARLGDPALLRRDAPAEIWQYRSPLCVLDLFLYRDGPAMRVTNAELRPRDGRELPATTCLSSL